jgi:phosphohistidine swiveling domain-containing protein
MSNKFEEVRRGNLKIQSYLEEYGHLRPGTWDIRSLTYSESPETYFNISKKIDKGTSSTMESSNFSFSDVEIKKMQNILDALDFKININDLLSFIKDSISAREYAKFIFSRNVSEILQIITRTGSKHNISRSDLSYVDIGFFLDSDKMNSIDINHLKEVIKQNKDIFNLNQQIILPQLIFSENNAHIVQNFKSRANYITVKKIIGEIVIIDGKKELGSIKDKIVLIESADPGYDWIFTHKIKGLITKYGGAASHMAIRSSEFDLPAAIGLGQDFEKIKQAEQIQLDCESKRVSII